MTIRANQLWVVNVAGELSDLVRKITEFWDGFNRRIIGTQLVRAADSVGANIAEGYGRCHTLDALRFYSIARGSLEETMFWLRRAKNAGLIDNKTYWGLVSRYQILSRSLNKFIQTQQPAKTPLTDTR